MNVLSLFDGMSCGQIALLEAGIKVDKYFASEIDKHAIAQTQLNFPNTIQLGDVTKVKGNDLPKIDLLIGGSPCQGFSFAGKQLNFNDPRSALFFEFVRILKEVRAINPNVKFLLENVRMRKEYEAIISNELGLFPVEINSALVSAQNRVRLYWTNIRTREEGLFSEVYTDIPQPEDRGILLKDILEPEEVVPGKYNISESSKRRFEKLQKQRSGFAPKIDPDKSGTLLVGNNSSKMALSGGTTLISELDRYIINRSPTKRMLKNAKGISEKANCLLATAYKGAQSNGMTLVPVFAEPTIYQLPRGENKGGIIERKTPTLTACAWEQNNILCISSNQAHATVAVNKSTPMVATMGMGGGHIPMVISGIFRTHKADYGFREIKSGKAGTIPARARQDGSNQNVAIIGKRLRRLTPTECARLQTIPEWYVWRCSETQIYKMLGNGWTVEVIKHIFSFL